MSNSDPNMYAEYSEEKPVSEEDEGQEKNVEDEDQEAETDQTASGQPKPLSIERSLKEAIDSAPLEQLQLLFTYICSKNEVAAQLASLHLLVPVQGKPSQKRRALEQCKNCGIYYHIVADADNPCVYHPGYRIIDLESDIWIDHNHQVHGDPASLYNEPGYEEGYKWVCCDRHGPEGCVTSVHVTHSDADASPQNEFAIERQAAEIEIPREHYATLSRL